LVVYTDGRGEYARMRFAAGAGDVLDGQPLVVLVNGATASAAEIVAGALQDHGRALIAGSRSRGKGTVQTLFPIRDRLLLKLTTAHYYTPRGRSIERRGIQAEVSVGTPDSTVRRALARLTGKRGILPAEAWRARATTRTGACADSGYGQPDPILNCVVSILHRLPQGWRAQTPK
jgi:C-terminal processing protease CtpA/Prc